MDSKPDVFVIFPSCGSVIRPSLPSTGFPGAGSPTSSVLWKTPIPPPPSRTPSASPWGPVPSPESFHSLRVGRPLGVAGCRSARSGSPLDQRGCFDGRKEASQVPGGPSRTCPALRPRRVHLPLARSGRRCCLPPCQRRRHPRVDFRGSITRPMRSLSTLHGDGHPPPRKTRFRLGTSLGRAGLYLQGPSTRFLLCLHRIPLAQASPGALT